MHHDDHWLLSRCHQVTNCWCITACLCSPSVQEVHTFKSHRVQHVPLPSPGHTRPSAPTSMLQRQTPINVPRAVQHTRAVQHDGHPQHQAASGTCAASSHQRFWCQQMHVAWRCAQPHAGEGRGLAARLHTTSNALQANSQPTTAPDAGTSGLKTTPHQSLRPQSTQHKPPTP